MKEVRELLLRWEARADRMRQESLQPDRHATCDAREDELQWCMEEVARAFVELPAMVPISNLQKLLARWQGELAELEKRINMERDTGDPNGRYLPWVARGAVMRSHIADLIALIEEARADESA